MPVIPHERAEGAASVGIYWAYDVAGHAAMKVDPDSRSAAAG